MAGFDDPRAALFWECLRFVYLNRPLFLALENSALMYTFQKGLFIRGVLALLRRWGYHARVLRVHTEANGIPHYRHRTYVLAAHQDVATQPPTWPPVLAPMPLADLLRPRCREDNARNHPTQPVAARAVEIAQQRAARDPDKWREDWLVSVHHSRRWTEKGSHPSALVPSLTHSLDAGPWLGQRGRRMLPDEGARAQGLCYHKHAWPEPRLVWKLLGNTMSGNVISRLITVALNQLHPEWSVADQWRNGEAQRNLRDDALHTQLATTTLTNYGLRPVQPIPAPSVTPRHNQSTRPRANAPAVSKTTMRQTDIRQMFR